MPYMVVLLIAGSYMSKSCMRLHGNSALQFHIVGAYLFSCIRPLASAMLPLQLADTKWGVIGLQWRAVSCDYKPVDPAPALAHPTPGQKPPKGTERPPPGYWNKPRNQWPGKSGSLESDVDASLRLPGYAVVQAHIFLPLHVESVSPCGQTSVKTPPRQLSMSCGFCNCLTVPPLRDPSVMHRAIHNQTAVNNWTIQGYNTILYPNNSAPGTGELITQCAIIAPNSSFAFTAPGPGFFLGKLSIAFWAQYATGAQDLQLTLASSDITLPQVPVVVPLACVLPCCAADSLRQPWASMQLSD